MASPALAEPLGLDGGFKGRGGKQRGNQRWPQKTLQMESGRTEGVGIPMRMVGVVWLEGTETVRQFFPLLSEFISYCLGQNSFILPF